MNKKAFDPSPINLIIVFAISLLVLFLVSYFFIYKGANPFQKTLGDCKNKGGQCLESCSGNYPTPGFSGCYDEKSEYHGDWTCCFAES